MQAVYDLSRYPANFNFVEFLVAAVTEGATHIVFDDSKGYKSKFSKDETSRRVASILIPVCDLAGVTHSFGKGAGFDPGYHISTVIKTYKKHGRLTKLKSVLPHGSERFTVTLRLNDRYKERNSDERAWRRFAEEIGAYVIEEYQDKPLHLHERMALYMGAEMNFSVANGPTALCYFSDAPFISFMKNVNPAYHKEHWFPVGSQLPWLNKNQVFIWSDDSYEDIASAWIRLMCRDHNGPR